MGNPGKAPNANEPLSKSGYLNYKLPTNYISGCSLFLDCL